MVEFPTFSLHLFDVSNFQLESSAGFAEIDGTDLLEMREKNHNWNAQRSIKTWVKVLDLRRAGRSEVRKVGEIFPKTSLTTFFANFI